MERFETGLGDANELAELHAGLLVLRDEHWLDHHAQCSPEA